MLRIKVSLKLIIIVTSLCAIIPFNQVLSQVKQEHPRIWLTEEKLAELKNRAERGVFTWQRLKSWCDEHINDPESDFLASPGYSTNFLKALNFAIAYKITQDQSYSSKALSIVKYAINNPPRGDLVDWFSYYNWYPSRYALPTIALTLDWCWETISESDRKLIMDKIRYACNGMLLEEDKLDWHQPGANHYLGDMWGLFCGAYVLANEPGYSDDAQRFLDYAKLMLDQSIKYTKGEEIIWENWGNNIGRAKGGMWDEGTGYGCVNNEMLFSSILATMSAENISYEGYEFPNEVIKFYCYAITPDGKQTYSYGDGAVGELDATVRLPIVITIAVASEEYKKFGQYWINHFTSNWTLHYKLYNEFIWYDDTLEEVDYSNYLPDHYFVEGGQVLFWRENWDNDATWMAFRIGLVNINHGHNGFGNFIIFKGNYLTRDTAVDLRRYEDYSDIYHNVLYIPLNQDRRMYWGASVIEHLKNTEEYLYFAGDMSNPYLSQPEYRNNTISHKEREFFLIKNQKILFIMDRGESFDPSYDKIFQMYVYAAPQNEGNFYRVSNGHSDLLFRSIYPDNSIITASELNNLPIVKISTPEQTRGKTFLTLLKVTSGGGQLVSSGVSIEGANLVGGIVRSEDGLRDYVVVFSNDIQGDPIQSNNFTISFDRFSNIIDLYVMNCPPSTQYYIKLTNEGAHTNITLSTSSLPDSFPVSSDSEGITYIRLNVTGEQQPVLPPSGIRID
ncbi:MAG: hypothetical protein DRJ45_07080 [Thermoprotei archaeon]|nr:MAG: hypothetical protein DRJ45_07080 [Thermoprotei archaeon]